MLRLYLQSRHVDSVYYTFIRNASSSSTSDFQYMQRSKIPTLHFQPSLPRLPIPELEKTCERYLKAQRPLLNDNAYATTEKIVKEFEQSGKELQEMLKSKDKKNRHTSYISAPWFDMYHNDRVPLPINYNPFLIHNMHPNTEYNKQDIKAANLIVSSLRFMKSLRTNILEPEVYYLNPKIASSSMFKTITSLTPKQFSWYAAYMFNAYPLDMSQYDKLFNATRIPEPNKDRIVQNAKARHAVIIKNGHFYAFDVLDSNGNILPPASILAAIRKIISENLPESDFPIGYLTTENRDSWAKTRKLFEDLGNRETLETIDSAVCLLALDDCVFGDDKRAMIHNFLCGNAKNRWFDKTMTLIVSTEGLSGINFEHSWGDGVAVLRYFQDIYKDGLDKPQVHPNTLSNIPIENFKYLDVKLDGNLKNIIKNAKQKYDAIAASLDVNMLSVDGIGKKLCKQKSLGPDSVMQLGFQCAFYKQLGMYGATYESCSTAAFKHGRTETIRPCTTATKAFSDALHKKTVGKSELRAMLNECSKIHNKLTREAAMGQGFDRHLFALKNIAEANGMVLPAVFQDKAYESINHNLLSTSTLSSPAILAGGFGSTSRDAYGVGYLMQDDQLSALVTNYLNERNGPDFIQCLQKSFEEIRDLIIST